MEGRVRLICGGVVCLALPRSSINPALCSPVAVRSFALVPPPLESPQDADPTSPRLGSYVLPDYGRDPLAQRILAGEDAHYRRVVIDKSGSVRAPQVPALPSKTPPASFAQHGVASSYGLGAGPLLPPPSVRSY